MADHQVVERLLRFGRSTDGGLYTENRQTDRFIRTNWNAWFIGVIFDQGIPAQKAWEAPHLLKQRLGHFNMQRLASTSMAELRRAVREAPALHRYVGKLPIWIKAAARKLVRDYGGDASNIWKGCLTAGEVIERLDDFPGIGQKKAHMAARALHELACDFYRWDQINMAVDVHVRRVWKRAGLVNDTSTQNIMATATRLWPKYPGELDAPTWWIGLGWCHARGPDCEGTQRDDGRRCPLIAACAKVGIRKQRPRH